MQIRFGTKRCIQADKNEFDADDKSVVNAKFEAKLKRDAQALLARQQGTKSAARGCGGAITERVGFDRRNCRG